MHKNRLSLMVDMLDEVARGTWRVSRVGFKRQDRRTPAFLPDVWITGMNDPLGHAACAIGFACLDSRFEGLDFENLEPSTRVAGRTGGVPWRTVRGWDAVCAYFDLDKATAQALFGPEGSPASPAIVRDWVRDLIERPASPALVTQAAV